MGRGKGKHNLSDDELRKRQTERNKEWYNNNYERIRSEKREMRANAGTTICDCGGTYLNLKFNKERHLSSTKHELYETELEAIQLLNILGFDEDKAKSKIDELCIKNGAYTTLDKCVYIGEKLIKMTKKQIAKQQSNQNIKIEVKENPTSEN